MAALTIPPGISPATPLAAHTAALPPIPDRASGLEILSRLPLSHPQQAELDLNHFFDALRAAPPDAATYLDLLEQTRVPLSLIAGEQARSYLSKPLPLSERATNALDRVVATWLKAAHAYAHCAQLATARDDAEHAQFTALILHRCIYYTGMAIVEHQRAHRQQPPGLWLDLHGYYASAEEWGVATLTVTDTLDLYAHGTHCAAAFVSLLLGEMASPYSLTVDEQRLARRWARHWAPLVTLHAALPGERLPPCVVDLMRDGGLHASAECLQTEHLRCLDTSRLTRQLTRVRLHLQQGIPPAQLGLGDGCSSAQCQHLLEQLAQPWSQARAPRRFRRHAAAGLARMCTGFEAMHFYVAGGEFTQPENTEVYSRLAFDSLFTFRHMVDPQQPLQIRQGAHSYDIDTWEVVNQSAKGFRLLRSIAGRPMEHRQLLALCPNDGDGYLLACAVWLMQETGGGLVAGIAALPGMPQAVAMRPLAQPGAHAEMYSRAFLLAALPTFGSTPSLVVPLGCFHAGRIIEIYTDTLWRIKLLRVLEGGPDFERVSFLPC